MMAIQTARFGDDDFFVKSVLASRSAEAGTTVRTLHMRYPRVIHSELMTHRVFTRNARSSRAVPSKVLLAEKKYEPIKWGLNQKGMQARDDELTGIKLWAARRIWHGMAGVNRLGVRALTGLGLHKQWANRPLEWFGWIDVLVTSVYWENFLVLRDHKAAMPEIEHLARLVRQAIEWQEAERSSRVQLLRPGEWHLPFVYEVEKNKLPLETLKILSTARCARISYAPFEGSGDHEAEKKRFDLLMGDIPIHATPSEHQCTPDEVGLNGRWRSPDLHGNLHGWVQHRKLHAMEFFNEYKPHG